MKEKARLRIDVLTLFPKMFEGPLTESILKKARERGVLKIEVHNIRDFATGRHRITDDAVYGGGGMLLKPGPIFRAVESLKKSSCVKGRKPLVVLMSPAGKVFNQKIAKKLARRKRLILVCGHYEGVDERVRKIADEEISIGDYVLTGGELPAMVLIDAAARMIKGVVGKDEAPRKDSFYDGMLDCPHYTRPREFRGMKAPSVLLSGDHGKVREWRCRMAARRTKSRRPDLLKGKKATK